MNYNPEGVNTYFDVKFWQRSNMSTTYNIAWNKCAVEVSPKGSEHLSLSGI